VDCLASMKGFGALVLLLMLITASPSCLKLALTLTGTKRSLLKSSLGGCPGAAEEWLTFFLLYATVARNAIGSINN
jgi:hypothetical protein